MNDDMKQQDTDNQENESAPIPEEETEGKESDTQEEENDAMKSLIAERDEYLEMAKRQMAEFANYRRRTETLRKDTEEESRRDTIRYFLPVLDNLERAMDASGEEESPLKEGLAMVLRQMHSTLEQLKVEEINPMGEAFDALSMNAVLQGTEDEGEPGTVCGVLQKGYRMGDKVIRHAMVKVVAG